VSGCAARARCSLLFRGVRGLRHQPLGLDRQQPGHHEAARWDPVLAQQLDHRRRAGPDAQDLMEKRPRLASGCELISAKAPAQAAPIQNRNPSAAAMARLEALLAPVADGEEFRGALAALSRQMGGNFTWLDSRNASIALTAGPRALPVQVLLEIRPRSELSVLVRGREGMGNGAPLSTAVLERLLAGLQAAAPEAAVRFRSDRDGPIRQAAAA